MTPSQLSIIVKSQGVEKAAQDLDKLAKAAASVDSETKAFVIAQGKLADSNQKVGKSSEATARGISVQELAILKAHEAALKMNATIDRQVTAQDKLNNAVQMTARGVTQQELAMVRAHEQALKMNAAFDKQADSLKNVSHHGSIFNNTLRSMTTAALAYMGVNFFAGIIKDADAWAMMQSKLNLAVGSMVVARNVQNDLYEMSQRLRVPLEDSIKLFTRMAPPLQKMGLGIKDTKQVVESFSTALKLAGATGQEASSAMLQFSQSINAGRLNGGEFNSIAEASPNVLRAIEKELVRTGRGAELAAKGLKKLAADGKLTTEVLVNSLKNAAPQWQKDFESLPLTVDGALQRIKNAWLKVIGDLGQSTKFNEKIAASIAKLEEMLPAIANTFVNAFTLIVDHGGKVLTLLSSILAVLALYKTAALIQTFLAAAQAAGALAGGLAAVRAGLLAIGITPVGLALTALAATIALVTYNWDSLTKSISKTDEVNVKVMQSSGDIVKGIQAENAALEVQIDKLRRANEKQEKYNSTKLDGIKIGSQKELDELNRGLKVLENNLKDAEKAAKAVQGASLFDPSKISKTQKAKEDIAETQKAIDMQKRMILIATAEQQKNQRLESERAQEQRDKDVRDKVTAIYNAAKTEKQLLDEEFKKKRDAAKQDYEKLGYDKMYYNQELLNIDKEYYKQLETINKKVKKPKAEENVDNINKLHSELDLRDRIIKSVEEYTKIQGKQTSTAVTSQENAQAELDKVNALIEGYSDKKQALIDLQITEATAEQNAKSNVVRTMQEVFALTEKLRILKELKVSQGVLSGLDAGKKAFEDYEKFMDSAKVDKFGKSFTDSMGKASKAVTNVSKVLENMSKTYSTLNKQQENLRKAKETGFISEERYQQELANIESSRFGTAMNLYGDMAEAAKGFFEEGSKGYKTLDGISKVVHAAQLARNLVEMGQLAVKAVMNQAGGDPYTAWARMGAMAATMAALGFAVGGGFNKSSGGATAADVQKTQGTGSVFGDASAKSDSVKASLDLLKTSFDRLYPVNQGMLKALKNIESSMTGLTNLVVRSGGIVEGSNFGVQEGTISKSSMSWTTALILGGVTAPILKLLGGLWGKTTQSIVDSGLQFGGSLQSLKQGQGFSQYVSVDTTKSSWFGLKKTTSNSVQSQGLSDELNSQFAMIFTNMQKSLEEAGKVLYGSSKGVTQALENMVFEVSKVSLKGLTGQALTDAINGVISKALDQMAGTAFTNLEQFRQVGEGYAQTVLRVANSFSIVNATFDKLGMKLYAMDDAGIKAAMSFTELFDSVEEMQSVASDYYDKFYTEQEKQEKIVDALKKQFTAMNEVLPESIKAYRELVDNTTDPAKIATLWKLSGAFSEVFGTMESVKDIPQKMKDAFESLSNDAQRWLSIRNQAAALKDEINVAMGNPKRDPAIRMQQLWDAMSKDVTPEQKLQLAGELKDLMLQKYQVEKDSLTRLIDFGKQLRGYVDSLKVGTLSPLTMGQKLAEAQAQYQATFAKAQGGDVAAQGMLQGKADTYLQLAQTALASSSEYSAIFSEVTNGLDSLGIESMSAAEQANQTATEQLAELQRLSDFVGSVEVTANSYYNSSLTALASQITLMDAMYQKMGIFDGMLSSIASLPAEIAAALSGKVGSSFGNDEFIRNLYQSVEGRVGSQIDPEGYNYWMKDLMTSTKEQVANNFVMASQENNINRNNSSTSSLEAQVAALTAEVKGLREDQNAQTGALINTQLMTSETSTAAIVTATKESVKDESWQNSLKPELV